MKKLLVAVFALMISLAVAAPQAAERSNAASGKSPAGKVATKEKAKAKAKSKAKAKAKAKSKAKVKSKAKNKKVGLKHGKNVRAAKRKLSRKALLAQQRAFTESRAKKYGDYSIQYQDALTDSDLNLHSAAALVVNQQTGEALYAKNSDVSTPIASITKLMTAMVVLDSGLPLLEPVSIDNADVDRKKGSRSKLKVGTTLMRSEMLKLALMASENRAAAALARNYPGGTAAFVAAMNEKAAELDMRQSSFVDATGLNPGNVSTADDLAKMVAAAHRYPLIRDYTTSDSFRLEPEVQVSSKNRRRRHNLAFVNSNRLIKSRQWEIGLSKTGYISEAGRCLVMQAMIADKPMIIVLLDSWGKLSRIGDANRIKRWIETDVMRVHG
jgi:D-alanyl-D-alanine endopeptidase (penicillin-binding protein 7)